MDDVRRVVEEIAADLWHRFRAIALVIDQSERFVAAPPAGETIEGKELWLSNLHSRREEIAQIAEDLVLRAFRAAIEPMNYAILKKLNADEWVSHSVLMQITGLNLMALSERVNDLIQVGLAAKDVQTGQVQGTKAGRNLVELVEGIRSILSRMIEEKLRGQNVRERGQE